MTSAIRLTDAQQRLLTLQQADRPTWDRIELLVWAIKQFKEAIDIAHVNEILDQAAQKKRQRQHRDAAVATTFPTAPDQNYWVVPAHWATNEPAPEPAPSKTDEAKNIECAIAAALKDRKEDMAKVVKYIEHTLQLKMELALTAQMEQIRSDLETKYKVNVAQIKLDVINELCGKVDVELTAITGWRDDL
ncbi:hypothetical protein PHYPSEUDO_013066 [Phytophthora pseudosyringae]|uniref:Uncharacterized protein n=1 Tax=Phytophthora pseudosyringae TaxID=221518 RepID=A0A8T1W4D8_9STRA|nr:hypothetical protein PHYPSEUDO_013066 [Phytophthora pseudosyringae]